MSAIPQTSAISHQTSLIFVTLSTPSIHSQTPTSNLKYIGRCFSTNMVSCPTSPYSTCCSAWGRNPYSICNHENPCTLVAFSLLSGIWHCGWRIPRQLDMGIDSTSDHVGGDRLVGSLFSLAVNRHRVLCYLDWSSLKFQNQTSFERRMARQTNGN